MFWSFLSVFTFCTCVFKFKINGFSYIGVFFWKTKNLLLFHFFLNIKKFCDFYMLACVQFILFIHIHTPVEDLGFPRGGGANSPGGRQHTILPNFPQNCMKLKEFGPWGGVRPKFYYVDLPLHTTCCLIGVELPSELFCARI